LGFVGEHPYGLSLAVGHGPDRTHVVTRYRNWKKITARQGSLAAEPLTSAELARVPADATMVWLARFDPLCFVELLDLVADMPGEAPREEIEAALGLDLEADVFGALGQTFGLYMSDTTGGGGLASLVAFAAVEDEARLEATLAKGIDALREATRDEVEGRFAIREWEHAGAKCRSLSFPSIPVPLEVSLASSDGFLVLAATPAGLVAALDQAGGGAPGLAEHAALRGLGGETLAGLQAIQVTDTPRLLAGGYGLASLVSSAIANGVRSRIDAEREPGLVLPPFHALEAGARPAVWLSRIQGDDLIVQGECDGSLVANGTAWLGGAGAYIVGLGLMSAAAIPALVGAREQAMAMSISPENAQAWQDIASIQQAIDAYAVENQGRCPDSLEALVTPDASGRTFLDRDAVPVDPWGNPYQYEPPSEERLEPRVYSLGADGMPGGEGADADVEMFDWAETDSGY
jgi:general secretion pathway protein G